MSGHIRTAKHLNVAAGETGRQFRKKKLFENGDLEILTRQSTTLTLTGARGYPNPAGEPRGFRNTRIFPNVLRTF
jgi:hypothetical protein